MVAFPWHSVSHFKYNPYIGPFSEAIPPVIVGYIDSPMAVLFAVIMVIIAQFIDNLYLIPFMISEKVDINPLLSVVLTLAASRLLGPPGMVFAIPIYSIYKIIVKESCGELINIYCEDYGFFIVRILTVLVK